MRARTSKRLWARVSEDVHAALSDEDANRASFTRLTQETGEWMLRRGFNFDQAFEKLMQFFYSPIEVVVKERPKPEP